ncbi:MAG: SIMPL domain-containing protein [Bacteroidota bacterium]
MNQVKIFSRLLAVAASALFLCSVAPAQGQPSANEKNVKKIEVTGSAEQEITPDEIYFNISLREYMKDKTNKIDISTLEKQLQNAVNQAGILKENFRVENIYGNHWYWQKKKPEDFLASKRYTLKLSDLNKIDGIMEKVDAKGIESANVSSYTHSKMEQYRREIKTAALKAAKEKARYLLEGIGEQLGEAIEIQEMGNENPPQPMYEMQRNANMMMAGRADGEGDAASDIDFKKIKIRYEVRAVFAIK